MTAPFGAPLSGAIIGRRPLRGALIVLPALIVGAAEMSAPVTAFSAAPSPSAAAAADRFVGFDLGTSGARMSVVERIPGGGGGGGAPYREVHSDSIPWSGGGSYEEGGGGGSYDDADAWLGAVRTLLGRAASSSDLLSTVRSVCVSGTSASCLVVDAGDAGVVTRPARMYDYDVVSAASDPSYAVEAMELLDGYAPPQHTARARTGALAKLLSWHRERPLASGEALCHQADYVAMNLLYGPKRCGSGWEATRRTVSSDWHNCLKLGYDVRNLRWPEWMISCLEGGAGVPDAASVLPSRVVSPGEPLGAVSPPVADEFGLPADAVVAGGTTDSNAAFFAAAGASPPLGAAVTSLGSTLAIKQLSSTFVEDADRGVYSHRFPVFGGAEDGGGDGGRGRGGVGEAWLIGGASNVGCAVLRQQEFSDEELIELSKEIDPAEDSPLSYYPLTKKGERFPSADPERMPNLEPVPENRREYLHGILQGIGDVEREGFRVLGELGATPKMPSVVWSCGGGAKNAMWREMRQRRLAEICGEGGGPSVRLAENTEASYGAAILAAATFN